MWGGSQKHSGCCCIGVFLEGNTCFLLVFIGSPTPNAGENADVDGFCTRSEISPALSLMWHSSSALQPPSLRFEQRFGAGKGDLNQGMRGVALLIARLSGQLPSRTLLACIAANCTWMVDVCFFCTPPRPQPSSD